MFSDQETDDTLFDESRSLFKLFEAVLANDIPDMLVWDLLACVGLENRHLYITPRIHTRSDFIESWEYRRHVCKATIHELGGLLHAGISNLEDEFFGRIPGLNSAAAKVFELCTTGDTPFFQDGWVEWPSLEPDHDNFVDDVKIWLRETISKIATYAQDTELGPHLRQRPLAQLDMRLDGTNIGTPQEFGFVDDTDAGLDFLSSLSHFLVVGHVDSSEHEDTDGRTWLSLSTFAKLSMAAQDPRRFAVGFSICKSKMRVWKFSRLGGIGSEQFDVNVQGQRFVRTILGFLCMHDENLGFDPTIKQVDGKTYIDIERNGRKERIVLVKVLDRHNALACRGTTCWEAYSEDDPTEPLVVKDSWQQPGRIEEGELLRHATESGVVNIAQYYYHGTISVHDKEDDVLKNVWSGLGVAELMEKETQRQKKRATTDDKTSFMRSESPFALTIFSGSDRHLPSSDIRTTAFLPNRVHRRLIMSRVGKRLYEATSFASLLAATRCGIEAHQSLLEAGSLHRDISPGNILIDPNDETKGFLIDLELAEMLSRTAAPASRAREKAGTRPFMAIGLLQGEEHSFMHDLESFFWVLYLICMYYDGPGQFNKEQSRESWHSEDYKLVAIYKCYHAEKFENMANDVVRPYYKPLIPVLRKLNKVVFPKGQLTGKKVNMNLYRQMIKILSDGEQSFASQ